MPCLASGMLRMLQWVPVTPPLAAGLPLHIALAPITFPCCDGQVHNHQEWTAEAVHAQQQVPYF